jgi:hypothetical protein
MAIRIEYVPHNRIDRQLWDATLGQCTNRLIYARSIYLDALCGKWDALVSGYYEYLMPLPCNRKWGFKYLPDIPFLQQLGVFSAHTVTPEISNAFLQKVRKHFSYGNIYLNEGNDVSGINAEPLQNFVLKLNKPYQVVADGYTSDLQYDLRQANKHNLVYKIENGATAAILAYRKQYAQRLSHISDETYTRFEKLCTLFGKNNQLITRSVGKNGEQVAFALLLLNENRLYNLLSVNTPAGRKLNAHHFLYDRLVEEFSGAQYLLDFEGSDIPGIAFFYKHFGAVNVPYHRVHLNKLPWPLNRLKP